MSFAPGDEVVCVDDANMDARTAARFPIRGHHYTIRDVFPDIAACRLVEIVNDERPLRSLTTGKIILVEAAFFCRRFRPVKRENIELFRQMCVSKSPLVPIETPERVTSPKCTGRQGQLAGGNVGPFIQSQVFCAAACDDGSLTMDVGVASRKRHGPGKGSNAGYAEANQENRRRDPNSPSRTIQSFAGAPHCEDVGARACSHLPGRAPFSFQSFAVNNAENTDPGVEPLGYTPFRAASFHGAF